MWLLKKLNEDIVKYVISEKHFYSIGRKGCDFILEGDSSISRKHCTIYIRKKSEYPSDVKPSTEVLIVDEQSKYGTYLKHQDEWIKLKASEHKILKDGSLIKFGLMENIWSLEYKPVVVCTSGIQAEQKKEISNFMNIIDGELRNAWSKECSLLIVNEIMLTIKVILALINGIPIVTLHYLIKLVECIRNQISLPDCKKYRPDIKESILDASLVSLDRNNSRKELFKGKKFILPTRRQLENLKEVILSAGGKVELFSDNGDWKSFAEENIIMIQIPLSNPALSEELSNLFKQVMSFLKSNYSIRTIPESEIAQAVAYSSIEKYCNPKSTCFELRRSRRMSLERGDLLVEGTYETEDSVKEHFVVPCSSTINSQADNNHCKYLSQGPSVGIKRSYCSDEYETGHHKKRLGSGNCSKGLVKATSEASIPVIERFQNSLIRNKISSKESEENQSELQKNSNSKDSLIINNFEKQNNPFEDDSLQGSQNLDEFWRFDEVTCNNLMKRKLSTGNDSKVDGNSILKKAKISAESTQKQSILNTKGFDLHKEEINVDNAIVECNECCSTSSHKTIKTHEIVEDCDFSDFIGKVEKHVTDLRVEELNDTLYSLTVISAAYLKKDGSLIDPLKSPISVKKFKKQKIYSATDPIPVEQIEEEISDDGWLEPHIL